MPLSEVPRIHDISIVDVPAHLRRLAEAIEAGEYGRPLTVVVCMNADVDGKRAVNSFGYGPVSDTAACAALALNQALTLSTNALAKTPA